MGVLIIRNIIMSTMTAACLALYFVPIPYSYADSPTNLVTATYYKPPYIPSACFGDTDYSDLLVAGVGKELWNNGSSCGTEFYVRCVGPIGTKFAFPCRRNDTITVFVVDHCPSTSCGAINLSEDAFALIADPKAGRILVEFQETLQG